MYFFLKGYTNEKLMQEVFFLRGGQLKTLPCFWMKVALNKRNINLRAVKKEAGFVMKISWVFLLTV